MSLKIDKLKDLQLSSNFIISKNNGLKMKELKDLSYFPKLYISKLENMVKIQDARDVSLELKKQGLKTSINIP